jgi:chemotaxis protein methyltransferase CheR
MLFEKTGRRSDARRAFLNAESICAALPPETEMPHTDGERAGRLAEAARARAAKLTE